MNTHAESGQHEQWGLGSFEKTTRPAHEVFHDLFTRAKRAQNQTAREALAREFAEFNDSQLSFTPNIFSELSIEEQLTYALEFSRIPEAQGTIGQHLVGEIVYTLAQSRRPDTLLRRWLHDLSVEQQLDALSYLATIGADAMAQGWADNLADAVEATVHNVAQDKATNPFLRYAAKGTLAAITMEHDDPSRGVVIRQGDRSIGRRASLLPEHARQESTRLRRMIRSTEESIAESTLLRISRDAVASFDQSLTPQSFAFFDKHTESRTPVDAESPDPRHLAALREFLESPQRPSKPDLRSGLDYAERNIKKPSEKPEEFWHQVAPHQSKETWTAYWEARAHFAQLEEEFARFAHQQQQNSEAKNEQLSAAFVAQAKDAADTIDLERFNGLREDLQELNDPDLERQFVAAERLAMIGRMRSDASPACEALAKALDKLHRLHQKNFATAQRKIEAQREHVIQTSRQDSDKLDKLEAKVLVPETFTGLHAYTVKLERASVALRLPFYDFARVGQEAHIVLHESPIDVSRLLSELHRPEVRAQVEDDMGVTLAELSLREQGQLLTFLALANANDVERTFALTRKFGTHAARSFLSAEFGTQFREYVLSVGERLPEDIARQVFERFAGLADFAQKTTDELAKEFFTPGHERAIPDKEIRDNLLKKGRTLLERASVHPEEHGALLAELGYCRDDVALLGEMFKYIRKEDAEFSLENVRGITNESIRSTELSGETQREMKDLFLNNWQKEIPDDPEKVQTLYKAFMKYLEAGDPNTRWQLLRQNGTLCAFLRFDLLPNGDSYLGSVNVAPALHDKAIGNAFLHERIAKEGTTRAIQLHSLAPSVAASNFVEKHGFVIDGIEDYAGIATLHMTRPLGGRAAVKDTTTMDFLIDDASLMETLRQIIANHGFIGNWRIDKSTPNIRHASVIAARLAA